MYAHTSSYNDLCKVLICANTIFNEYRSLTSCYVSDFYVEKHWNMLPKCWKEFLEFIDRHALASIINCTMPLLNVKVALPLSLLALRILIKHVQIARGQSEIYGNLKIQPAFIKENSKLFWKHVKEKKKHEIEIMSAICFKMATQTKCNFVVDVGSGLGHLIRILAYGYGLKACGLEAKEKLTLRARNLDKNLVKAFEAKKFCMSGNVGICTHLNVNVKTDADGLDIITILEDNFGKDLCFGIVGLHSCGELSVALLQLFMKYPQVKFINVVGCCYMKLNGCLNNFGYPISNLSKKYGYTLSYADLEVACHALEMYIDKLKSKNFEQLKIHSYRAALEKLIVRKYPEMYHSMIGSVRYSNDLTFSEYVSKAISKLNIEIDNLEVDSDEIKSDLKDWHKVVTFFSLRLMLAPLIENIILLDRVLCIIESGHNCYITSAFDPGLSPRNYVISAIRN